MEVKYVLMNLDIYENKKEIELFFFLEVGTVEIN